MKKVDGAIPPKLLNIILADDDKDDCMLFGDAMKELPVSANLSIVHNGVQLMKLLAGKRAHPCDVLFLDLNMPLKNGFECLKEIKCNPDLKHVPVIIFSTSYEVGVADVLYKNGADFYIRKPPVFLQLKNAIEQAIALTQKKNIVQTTRENFLIRVIPV